MSLVTIPILRATRWSRACVKCGRPITLAKRADTQVLCAFEPDPADCGIQLTAAGLVELWSVEDRHKCQVAKQGAVA
jgi:hypothetical protein